MKKALAGRLLDWYDHFGRTLPFRGTKNPYAIWVSEIMLQQTRTETAGGYFLRFMERFPTVFDLAAAPEQDVLKLWEGLGYYSRARNLHKAAKKAVQEWQGTFPADYEQLLSLPGVGEYTAAAIASIAFDLPCPAMDGNLTRVLSRVHGVREDVGIPSVKRQLLELAKGDMPPSRCGDFNQALMDLGASHCCPGTPDCDPCPLKALCDARKAGDADMLPIKAVQRPPMEIEMAAVVITCKNKVLLHQRKEALLKNLWVYPLFEEDETAAQVTQAVQQLGLEPLTLIKKDTARHVFTHRIWQMQLWHCEVKEAAAGQWFTLEEMQALPIPTAVKAARQLAEKCLALTFHPLHPMKDEALLQQTAQAYSESWLDAHQSHATEQLMEEHSPLLCEMLLRSHISTGKDVYAVVRNEHSAGVLVLDREANEICLLYLHPDAQKQHIGSQAVQFAIRQLDKNLDMRVTALEKNPHALKTYKNAGFLREEKRQLLNKAFDLWEITLIRPGEKA